MGSRLTAIVLTVALLASCAGPRVQVSDVSVQPPTSGHVRVQAHLHNSGGAGEVKVLVRLRDRATGRTYVATRALELEAHRDIEVVVDVPAPPSDYGASVTASFPPE